MSLFGNGWMQKYSRITEKFVIWTRKLKKIFVEWIRRVDQTLLKRNRQRDYYYY